MRKLSNPSSRRKARQLQAGKATPNPARFVTLAFVIIVSVAAGTTLGATMVRLELRGPADTAVTQQPAAPAAPQQTSTGATKTVIAVKTSAVKPLQPRTDNATINAPVASLDRFGQSAEQTAAAGNTALADRLRSKTVVDASNTGSIQSNASTVEIAESEDEIIALENKLSAEGAEHFNLPDTSQEKPVSPPVQQALQTRQTAKYVNLRAGPDNDADVLTVVPARTELLAETGCVHWCAAVYQGQKGYIYKTFFRDTTQ